MPRLLLSDELWPKLEKILLQQTIYHKPDLRMTVEGMLYRMRVGCPWRDLPRAFGCWNSVYKRFNAWSAAGKWLSVFNALLDEPDFEWTFIDGTYVKAHQHSTGAASGQPEAIGKSRAGHTSKIHLAVDAHGLPVAFEITGGDISDCTAAPELIAQLPSAEVIVGDKGYAHCHILCPQRSPSVMVISGVWGEIEVAAYRMPAKVAHRTRSLRFHHAL